MGARHENRKRSSMIAALLTVSCASFVFLSRAMSQTGGVSPAVPEFSTVRAVRSLSAAEAARAYPVHLTATVAFYDPFISSDIATLFVRDETGGIFVVVPTRPTLPLREGTVVEVSGVSEAGEFAPVITKAAVRPIGQAPMPSVAPLVTLRELMTGSFDSQWVQIEGIVHAVRPQDNNMILKIVTGGGAIMATMISEPGKDYSKLIGARICTYAVVGSRFNTRRQLVGVHLFVSTLSDVTVLQDGIRDPYSLPARSIKGWSAFETGKLMPDRVRLRGVVTLQRPGQLLCIEDEGGGLCVDTLNTEEEAIGSLVDVVGFRAFDEGSPKIVDAMYRSVHASGTSPTPTPIKASEALQGGHSGDFVELRGEITGLNADPHEPSAIIASDGILFSVLLPPDLALSDVPTWQKGSRVRVQGICTSITSRDRADERQGEESYSGFRLLLRSPRDLTVVHQPSWWTPPRAIVVLSVVLGTTLGALAWALMLHRRVRQQTGMIQESERRYRHLAYHDALTGLPNRTLLQLRLNAALEETAMTHRSLALLMVDLDGFKRINDQLGHDAGDVVLRTVADRLARIVREPDTVARIGGDEFIVLLLGGRQASDACACAERILRSFATHVAIGEETALLSCSIGISTFDARVDSPKSFLKKADAAMYQAKARGKDQYWLCSEDRSRDVFAGSPGEEDVAHAGLMTGALG